MLIVLPVWGKGGSLVLLLLGVRAVCYIVALRLVGFSRPWRADLFRRHLYIVLQEWVGGRLLTCLIWHIRQVSVVSMELIFSFVSWDLPSHYL